MQLEQIITIDEDKIITARFEEEYDDETSGFSSVLLLMVVISVAIFDYEKEQQGLTN